MDRFADRRTLFITAFCALVLSIVSTIAVQTYLTQRIAIVGDFMGLTPTQNPGIAFGMRFPSLIQVALIGIATTLVTFVALRQRYSHMEQIGFGLIIGGAIANIVDRLGDGLVTDLFQVGSFPVFNVADSCITIGAIVILLMSLLKDSSRA